MTAHPPLERMFYRLIITRRDATEILLSSGLSGSSLPRIGIFARSRVAEQLVWGVRKEWRLKTYCLFTGSVGETAEPSSVKRYAVMEAVPDDSDAPVDAIWIRSTAADANGMLFPAEQAAIRSALEELGRHRTCPEIAPFARPGWIQELFSWVRHEVEPLGLRPNGAFAQLNASPVFSLMRIETTGPAVWFKATGEPNRRELGISVALDRLFPGRVPRIIAVHPRWNGWLMEEAPGSSLDEITEYSAWETVARELAELQIGSIAKTAELLESPCEDLRLARLARLIDPFLTRMGELMAAQQKPSPAPLTHDELAVLGHQLSEACGRLESLGLPETLGHLDLQPANIVVGPGGCVLLDWAEGFTGHPFLTFEYLVEHLRRSSLHSNARETALRVAYAERWALRYPSENVSEVMSLAPLVAVFAHAVCAERWGEQGSVHDPERAGYLRAMTRRMRREAEAYRGRQEQCVDR
jgi:Phosphotransferase enzyme family